MGGACRLNFDYLGHYNIIEFYWLTDWSGVRIDRSLEHNREDRWRDKVEPDAPLVYPQRHLTAKRWMSFVDDRQDAPLAELTASVGSIISYHFFPSDRSRRRRRCCGRCCRHRRRGNACLHRRRKQPFIISFDAEAASMPMFHEASSNTEDERGRDDGSREGRSVVEACVTPG